MAKLVVSKGGKWGINLAYMTAAYLRVVVKVIPRLFLTRSGTEDELRWGYLQRFLVSVTLLSDGVTVGIA